MLRLIFIEFNFNTIDYIRTNIIEKFPLDFIHEKLRVHAKN